MQEAKRYKTEGLVYFNRPFQHTPKRHEFVETYNVKIGDGQYPVEGMEEVVAVVHNGHTPVNKEVSLASWSNLFLSSFCKSRQ